MADANNDMVILQSSGLFDDVIDGVAPNTSFYANDVEYKYEYYLVDGIYSEWAMLVETLSCPDDEGRLYYKKKQEPTRKDVERVFGVLKKRWSIIAQPSRILEKRKMRNVMYTCIILHNMILEDSGRAFCGESYDEDVLAIQIPIVAYESAFSMSGRVLDAYRTRLSSNIVEVLVCTQDWVRKSKEPIIDDTDDILRDGEIAIEIEDATNKQNERGKEKMQSD
ncbi:uncharacterized protein LOC110914045 [Helianthus annuus]|uniref:uncharacterized protein LOC110914045 n=1 Tax=Helianthus annuus TaxID=4232 RepID=UPI000B8F21C2|nr:uncharacterized protein LOC110914045 [Helianthus annuus]